MVMLKCLQQYFTATGDKRVLSFMNRYFAYMYRNLDEKPLGLWAIARAGDNIQIVQWLYNITGQKALLKLCDKLIGRVISTPSPMHGIRSAPFLGRCSSPCSTNPAIRGAPAGSSISTPMW